jgi:uncharacterized protein (TIGR02996 family)
VTTEDDFQAALDANPEDWQTRLVLADWLQEHGDVRAEGYRAIAVLRVRPHDSGTGSHWWSNDAEKSWSAHNGYNLLAADWYAKTTPSMQSQGCHCNFATRCKAEDRAARAFAKLSAARRSELLAGSVTRAPRPGKKLTQVKTGVRRAGVRYSGGVAPGARSGPKREPTVTKEDDFQAGIDANPEDWHTRLVFADWLEDRGDARAAGYRAIAALQRHPLEGQHGGLKRQAWWWHCAPGDSRPQYHNDIPPDWFTLLPARDGNKSYWPLHTATGGVRTRRQCEDALARVFTKLPGQRQTEILAALVAPAPKAPSKRKPTAKKKTTRTARAAPKKKATSAKPASRTRKKKS